MSSIKVLLIVLAVSMLLLGLVLIVFAGLLNPWVLRFAGLVWIVEGSYGAYMINKHYS